mgnify:CR=1 FL=1|tara:strand:- start:894 stop:1097 length:204 start_codon:yes stop_codon:yes gene_type:complete
MRAYFNAALLRIENRIDLLRMQANQLCLLRSEQARMKALVQRELALELEQDLAHVRALLEDGQRVQR